jgi:RNA polymerase sigma-70 factor (ECF subfamily)
MANGASAAELALHDRLLSGDPAATAEAAEALLDALAGRLRRARPDVQDPQLVEDAAIEAVLGYLKQPERYDPHRASLMGYLLMAAKRDLSNLLAKERRHAFHAVSLDGDSPSVELLLVDRNTSVEDEALAGLGAELPAGMSRVDAMRLIAEEIPDERDRRLLVLMAEGERQTSAYAVLLGIAHLSPEAQRREVKRHKDRLTKRAARLKTRVMDRRDGSGS